MTRFYTFYLFNTFRNFQRIGTFQVQSSISYRCKGIIRQTALGLLGCFHIFLAQLIQHSVGLIRQDQRRVCLFALVCSLVLIIDEVPERDVPATLCKIQIARP
jgi:hypothetical protein